MPDDPSSNINEIIRSCNINGGTRVVLFFKRKDFTRKKSTKSTKSTKNVKSTKSTKRKQATFTQTFLTRIKSIKMQISK